MDQLQNSRMQFLQNDGSNFENESFTDSDYYYTDDNTSTVLPTLPPDMTFTSRTLIIIISYCVCFIVALIGNLTVFLTLSRGRYRKSRITLIMFHLSIADLFVTFFTIPLEIGWRITVQWMAGNVACKTLQFFRAFGLYLSNNILICVSLDRYFAVLYPLRVNDARRRGKFMLTIAWIFSILYSIPQAIIFHATRHPKYKNFTQCVSFGSFSSEVMEQLYNTVSIACMYFVPLFVICWVYLKILGEISSKSRDNKPVKMTSKSSSNRAVKDTNSPDQGSKMRLRRSNMTSIERARSRTLKMTIKIVIAFIFCWTPYITMSLWYIFDRKSAEKVDESVQEALFIMAVSNSCTNPLVYGCCTIDLNKECRRCFLPCIDKKTNAADARFAQRSLVGSVRTKSTNFNKILAPTSPRPSATSVSVASKDNVTIEKLALNTIKPNMKENVSESPSSEPI